MLNRRHFLKTTFVTGAAAYAIPAFATPGYERLTILHTNDMHSRFEPFPASDIRNAGKGGMNRISAVVKRLRVNDPELLFFDCGDFSQGTPYYNFFKSELLFKIMSEMGYDASTVGNHEFDFGLDDLKKGLVYANFPLVSSNYDFSDTMLAGLVKKHLVFERKGIRVGVYGLGIELQGLVPEAHYGETICNNALDTARSEEAYLKNEMNCDLVVCLSHLGFSYKSSKISDKIIASKTEFTDIILGGHTHTFLDKPQKIDNLIKKPVLVNQVGWGALMLGRIDVLIEKNRAPFIHFSENKNME